MDNSIQVFNFENNSIRTIEIDNTIWFIAEDITTILEYDRVSNALRVVEDDDKLLITNKNSFSEFEKINIPDRGIFIINESGLYSLTLHSRKPEAKKFKKWITSEVLPSIRKTGSYNIVPIDNNQNRDLINKLLEIQSRSLELQSKAAERERQYLDLISKFDEKIEYEKYKSSINTVFELVNKIEFEKYVDIIKEMVNISIRANFNEATLKLYLYQSVKDHEKIFKSNGVPYERYIDNEFYIVENSKSNKVYITRKGSDHLFWFLKSKKIIGEING